jgi:Putative phage holin Dp-1
MSGITNSTFILSNDAYVSLKRMVQLVLPGLSSLYFGLDQIWDFPAETEVLAVLAIFAFCIGIVLTVSSWQFNNVPAVYDGEMVVIADGGGVRTFSLEVVGDPDDLAYKESIKFKVRRTSVPEPPE